MLASCSPRPRQLQATRSWTLAPRGSFHAAVAAEARAESLLTSDVRRAPCLGRMRSFRAWKA